MSKPSDIRRKLEERFKQASQGLRGGGVTQPTVTLNLPPLPAAFSPAEETELRHDIDVLKRALTDAKEMSFLGNKERENFLENEVKRLAAAAERGQVLEETLAGVRRDLEEAHKEIVLLREVLKQKEEKAEQSFRQLKELEGRSTERDVELDAGRQELEKAWNLLRAKEEEANRWLAQTKDLETQIAGQAEVLAVRQSLLLQTQNELENLKKSTPPVSDLQAQCEVLERQLAERSTLTRNLNQALRRLEDKLAEKETALAEGQRGVAARIDELTQALATARIEAENAQVEAGEWREVAREREDESRRWQERHAAAAREMEEVRAALRQREEELRAVQSALEVERQRTGDQADREDALKKMEETLTAKTIEVKDLESRLSLGERDLHHKVQELALSLRERETLLAARDKILENQKAALEGLTQELKIKEERLAGLTDEKDRLYRDMSQKLGVLNDHTKLLESRLSKPLPAGEPPAAWGEREKQLRAALDEKDKRILELEKAKTTLELRAAGLEGEVKKTQDAMNELRKQNVALESGSTLLNMNTQTLESMEQALRDVYRLMQPTGAPIMHPAGKAPTQGAVEKPGLWARFMGWWKKPMVKIPVAKPNEKPVAPAPKLPPRASPNVERLIRRPPPGK